MERKQVAKALGVSIHTVASYLAGTRRPKWATVEKMKPITGKSFDWWRKATLDQIRQLFERIGRANGNDGRK